MNTHDEYIPTDSHRAHERAYERILTGDLVAGLKTNLAEWAGFSAVPPLSECARHHLTVAERMGAELMFRGGVPGLEFLLEFWRTTGSMPERAIRQVIEDLDARAWEIAPESTPYSRRHSRLALFARQRAFAEKNWGVK